MIEEMDRNIRKQMRDIYLDTNFSDEQKSKNLLKLSELLENFRNFCKKLGKDESFGKNEALSYGGYLNELERSVEEYKASLSTFRSGVARDPFENDSPSMLFFCLIVCVVIGYFTFHRWGWKGKAIGGLFYFASLGAIGPLIKKIFMKKENPKQDIDKDELALKNDEAKAENKNT